MSRENVEIARRAYEQFERGNFWLRDLFDPEVRVVWQDTLAAGGVPETVGVEAMTQVMSGWLESWDRLTTRADRFVDAGDRVVVIGRWEGKGRASGATTEWRYGVVWTLLDGKVTEIVAYDDPAEALEAVGLRE